MMLFRLFIHLSTFFSFLLFLFLSVFGSPLHMARVFSFLFTYNFFFFGQTSFSNTRHIPLAFYTQIFPLQPYS